MTSCSVALIARRPGQARYDAFVSQTCLSPLLRARGCFLRSILALQLQCLSGLPSQESQPLWRQCGAGLGPPTGAAMTLRVGL